MREADFPEFSAMLEDVNAFYPTAKAPTAGQKAMFFRALRDLSIEDVRGAFDAHMRDPQRGRFAPLPADVMAHVKAAVADDGRPGVEAAWATAMRSADERETVVWTDEMARAWADVAPLFNNGDDVGARMAFKETYARLVDEARAARRAPRWTPSLGFDQERRTAALAAAQHLLEPSPDMPLIESRARLPLSAPSGDALQPLIDGAPPEERKNLLALRERINTAARERAERSVDAEEKARTDALRRASADRMAAHQQESTDRRTTSPT